MFSKILQIILSIVRFSMIWVKHHLLFSNIHLSSKISEKQLSVQSHAMFNLFIHQSGWLPVMWSLGNHINSRQCLSKVPIMLVVILGILSVFCLEGATASAGDKSSEFRGCLYVCRFNNCSQGILLSSLLYSCFNNQKFFKIIVLWYWKIETSVFMVEKLSET